MNDFFSKLENHQAVIAIAIFISTVIFSMVGFLIKKIFFPDKHGNSSAFIKAGGSISAGGDIIVGDKTIHNTTNINDETAHNLKTFERYLEEYNWSKEFIGEKEVWICEHNNLYQIEIDEKSEEFTEAWTKAYPDSSGSGKTNVYLTINGNRIKQLIFVYMDGGRIFVPLPEISRSNDKINYYWEKNSLDFKVGKIIAKYYIYNSLEGVAKCSKIKIND